MVSNFELYELKWHFEKSNECIGNEKTNYGDRFVVILNREQKKVAQIVRTSANRYDIIKASENACSHTYKNSFYQAKKIVISFLKNAGNT